MTFINMILLTLLK